MLAFSRRDLPGLNGTLLLLLANHRQSEQTRAMRLGADKHICLPPVSQMEIGIANASHAKLNSYEESGKRTVTRIESTTDDNMT